MPKHFKFLIILLLITIHLKAHSDEGNAEALRYKSMDAVRTEVPPLIDGDITDETLKKISVVPNPYLVYSDYDETPSERKLWFNHLPTRCRVTIYTISGERVASILHEDALSGKVSWNLRSQGGDLVAPGLYIYTVEAENSSGKHIKHISKFAIVR